MSAIAVLGLGGVGGFLAASLARASEDVIVVARPATAEIIEAQGITVQSVRLGTFSARLRTATELARPVDTLIVATKATTLVSALHRILTPPGLVVPMLNGVEHMTVLRERFGVDRVVAASIRIESDRPAPGRIVQTSGFLRVDLATDHPALRAPMRAVAERLDAAGVPTRIEVSEAQALWSKLVRLTALACTTAAADLPIGAILRDRGWRVALGACMEETAAVARAEGADIDPAASLHELEQAHPELGSSMQRDIAAGREPELDAIAGAVLRAAARHGLECPTVARLAGAIARRAGISPPAA